MINDFGINSDYDWELGTDDNGFITLTPVCNHDVVTSLIYTRLIHETNWDIVDDIRIGSPTRAQEVRSVIMGTYGVTDVDMSGFNPTITGDLGVICPVIDCDNSKTCNPL